SRRPPRLYPLSLHDALPISRAAYHGLGRLGCRRFERYRCLQVLGTDGFQTSEEVPKPSVVPGTKDLHHGRCTGDTPAAPAFHAESGRAHVAFGGPHTAQTVYAYATG